MTAPLVTIAVPSFNQGQYLQQALQSIFDQDVPVEVFVMDGGSTDGSLDIIRRWEHRLAGWRSHQDEGQAAAINEGIARGSAPYVAWLNSDDLYLDGGLAHLYHALEEEAHAAPAAYGLAVNIIRDTGRRYPVWVEPFSERRLAIRCFISQPATLIRRRAWEAVGGVDPGLHMVMDYDLWWRLYKACGQMHFVQQNVAANRVHPATKTKTLRRRHYSEAIRIVRKHYGTVPIKWWLMQPYAVWYKGLVG